MLLIRATAVLLVVGCACGPPETGGGIDAAREASGGAPVDAPDEPEIDAPPPSGWATLQGLPSACAVESAQRLDAFSWFSLTWSGCGTACRRTNAVAARAQPTYLAVSGEHVVALFPDLDGERIVIVAPRSGGAPLAVWRSRPWPGGGADYCAITVGALGDGRAAIGVRFRFARSSRGSAFYVAPVGEIAGTQEPVVVLDADPLAMSFPQSLVVSSDVLVAEMQPVAILIELSSGTARVLGGATARGLPASITAERDDVFWVDDGGERPSLAHATATDVGGLYFTPTAPGETRNTFVSGGDVIWLQTHAGGPPYEVWSGAIAEPSGAFMPRRAFDAGDWGFPRAGGGLYAVALATPGRLDVFELATGRRRTFMEPVDLQSVGAPAWVDAHRIIYRVGGAASGETLVEVDVAALP